eukprot:GHVN01098861.1.p1 GENE.GHVN01098861.1~~GHVN01098861.1.p1  ORF type:complete len:145 (-),score=0.46 GHVN01098861.1:327-761(-)
MGDFLIDSFQICIFIFIGSFFTLLNIVTFIVFVFDKWASRRTPGNGSSRNSLKSFQSNHKYSRGCLPYQQPQVAFTVCRVSERTLLLLAAIGGSIGAKLAQRMVRHKTQKQPFGHFLSAICVSQTALCIGLLYLYLYRYLYTFI